MSDPHYIVNAGAPSGFEWYPDEEGYTGYTASGITVARARYAKEGEAEGGLSALVRFMSGALAPHVQQPALSPPGWYWVGTPEERGIWTRAAGPFLSPVDACHAGSEAFARGAYLLD